MNRTMDVREKLVELLKDAQIASVDKCHTYEECKSCPNYGQGMLCRVPFSVDHLISHGVTVQEWISVKDRLPEKPMKCLVYTKRGEYGGYEITYYNEGFYLHYANITHWMPLPQPPKGE